MDDGLTRCRWAQGSARPDPRMLAYHDTEWGVPVDEDAELFERLSLEAFQAGLSWQTILNKRDAFRAAFRGFGLVTVAAFDDDDRARLMADAGIVRNRAKIEATIANARVSLDLIASHGSLGAYFCSIIPGPATPLPRTAGHGDIPNTTLASDALSADLRRQGMRFMGSTVVYAFMQSVGLVDDHLPGCFRYGG